ncbi:hypothetical protein SAMN02745136_01158 [Anaerocolumna jejuensis DSM 15929]|uniref:DUF4304 domain-containing protein n=1 Tax=Anaerocolumna jejuensis DSM 15929 TaxID=1121322 RepID=A0A1M6MTH1_9FIRM|nr:hypothetical protein [Anaerocolumna jejuensis]SHJ86553.1 hypothetical protein SAMN02745136_01158 [Anaerocolumna jejuensis DSM 15929]
MTSKEKKNLVLKEIVKPLLKKAGYRSSGRVYYSQRGNCCLALCLKGSHYNSTVTGYCFGFEIMAFEGEVTESIKKGWWMEYTSISEAVLLPDMGYLHPYRRGMEYQIDGYKNYQPQDMNLEDIVLHIREDLEHYILPELAQVESLAGWERKREEWKQRGCTERVRLLRYFEWANPLTCSTRNIPQLLAARRQLELPIETIRNNSALYHQIQKASPWPETDGWSFILSVLEAEEAAVAQLAEEEQT